MHDLDDTDLRILRHMQRDGNLTVSEIAERVGLSQSPCSRRIIQMQQDGIIVGKAVMLDRKKLGFDTEVLVRLKLKSHERSALDAFSRAILQIPEIQQGILTLGEFDFHLHIIVRSIAHYQALMQDKLVNLPNVHEMQSTVVLEVVKEGTSLPL